MTHHAKPSTGAVPVPMPHSESLVPFGWTSTLAESFWERSSVSCEPGRVVAATRGLALAQTSSGEAWCSPSGRFRAHLEAEGLALCAGDWIALQPQEGGAKAVMHDLLPRGPSLTRQAAGPGSRRQWLAANLDVVLVLMGLDRNFNPARMERFLALAWGSGAQPVVVLTKADLEDRAEAFLARIEGIAPGVRVLAVSSVTGEGLAEVRGCLPAGHTGVMVGSSGVGKSTLLNALAGQELRRTREIRSSDGRGRHTTSLRELFLLPGGGCLIDTPGIREVGLSAEGSDLDGAFSDIADVALRCRFRDCTHGAEPGCAVQEALGEGRLDPQRYGHYLRLRREVAFEAARGDERLWREREQKWRRISKSMKHFSKG
jgi:ribosome biogenesis GTPase / thiamine phosphate phosphatase